MNKPKFKVLICAGGTGGHIVPGIAIAKELIERKCIVTWLGSKGGMESQLVPKQNIEIQYISINGLRGKHWMTYILSPFKMAMALFQSLLILHKLKPALVVGMGGFVTGPCGVATWLLRIPLVIQEQNAIPGTTNKILSKLSKKVLEGFPNSFTKSDNVKYTGNPIRKDFLCFEKNNFNANNSNKLKLLIIGGSRGALALNQCIPKAIQKYEQSVIEILHQTGEKHLESTIELYRQLKVNAKVVPFIEDVIDAYKWADLVICRAGAITVAELTAAGKASVLVPFPYAIDDHQTKNAEYLSKAGAAILVQQKDFTPEKLINILQTFVNDRSYLLNISKAAHKLANYNALKNVVSHCLEFRAK